MEAGRRETGTGDETKLSSSGYRYFAKVLIYLSFLPLLLHTSYIFGAEGSDTDPTTSWSTDQPRDEPWNLLFRRTVDGISFRAISLMKRFEILTSPFFKIANPNFLDFFITKKIILINWLRNSTSVFEEVHSIENFPGDDFYSSVYLLSIK